MQIALLVPAKVPHTRTFVGFTTVESLDETITLLFTGLSVIDAANARYT